MSRRRSYLHVAVATAVLLSFASAIVVANGASTSDWVAVLAAWLPERGAVGWLLYVACYTAAAIALLPAAALTLLAGFAYGVGPGFALALGASTVAAAANFSLARWIGRHRVEAVLRTQPRLRALWDAADHNGPRWVLLLRLSPVVPFAVLNYVMGTSRMRLRDFLLASTIGKAPSALCYVYVGSAARRWWIEDTTTSWGTELLFWAGLVATAVVTFEVSRVVRARLQPTLEVNAAAQESRAKVEP